MSAPDSAALHEALRRHFGFSGFREHQQEIVTSVLEGRPTVAVMPTGAGKSLCYQLPALLLDGVTLVVSPLIALMKDQVDALRARNLPATFINSSLSENERQVRAEAMLRGDYKLIYLAPERFRSPRFLDYLERAQIALLAIDEAHCISQWGHDFRPDYARLGEMTERLRAQRVLALTATATREVREDICRALRMRSPHLLVAGFDRPNLSLEVIKVGGDRDKADHAAALARHGSGIVYAATRKAAERLALALGARGVEVLCYHAGLGEHERRVAQETFMASPKAVVVATSAFGMGVDKPALRFVAHAQVPRSLEAYYQEIGRAGRDGLPAQAVLLFNHADLFLQQQMIRGDHPKELLMRDLWALARTRAQLDLPLPKLADALGAKAYHVQSALRLLEQAGHLVRLGSSEASTTFELKTETELPARASSQRAALSALRALTPPEGAAQLSLGDLSARSGLSGESLRRALGALKAGGHIAVGPRPSAVYRVLDRELSFEKLRVDMKVVRWREDREMALLRRMAAYAYARSCRRRMILRYFGQPAAARCEGCDVCRGVVAAAAKPAAGEPKDTRLASLELFLAGASVEEVAHARGLTGETVRNHFADLLESGLSLPVERVVDRERASLILRAARTSAPQLEAIKRALPPDYLFGEIRVVLAARRAGVLSAGDVAPPATVPSSPGR